MGEPASFDLVVETCRVVTTLGGGGRREPSGRSGRLGVKVIEGG